MKKQKEWFENENFWTNYAPIMFDKNQWSQARGIAEKCVELADLKKDSKVLDVCCAVGRISIELALLGMNVTGVDITQPFLDAAKESAEDENVNLELINHDMRTFNSKNKFDAAINIYNSFGYCDKIEDDIKILKQVYKNLKKGGTFILECISRESAIKYWTSGEWFERENMTVLTEFSVKGAWEGLKSRWILIDKNGNKIDHTFIQRLYSALELRNILIKECKFKSVNIYGGFNKEPYDHNLKTMVIVCKK